MPVGAGPGGSAFDEPTVAPAVRERVAGVLGTGLPQALGTAADPRPAGLVAVLAEVDGRLVVERYSRGVRPEQTWNLFSITKSVVGTLAGIALDDGAIPGTTSTLGDLLPQHRREMDPATAALTLEQVLTMTAGLAPDDVAGPPDDVLQGPDWLAGVLRAGRRAPAGRFAYSSATSHVLGAVVARATGRSLAEGARVRLFEPLGIPADPIATPQLDLAAPEGAGETYVWPVEPSGLQVGWAYLALRPRDLLRLGELYLDRGTWRGQRVVSEGFVRRATSGLVEADDGLRYGYQWWSTRLGGHRAFAAMGYGGQLLAVVPALRLVAVLVTRVRGWTTTASAKAYLATIDRVLRGGS